MIGGGIVGLSTALELQARGRRVTLIDPWTPTTQASFGNAGVISRGSILAVASPSVWPNLFRYALNRNAGVRIRWRSVPQFSRWLPRFLASSHARAWRHTALALNPLTAAAYAYHERLAQIVGARHLVRRDGYLKLYRSDAAFAASALEREILDEAGVRTVLLGSAGIRDLEPALANIYVRALFFPDTGSVDTPGELVEAYRRAFLERGGKWLAGRLRRIRGREGGLALDTDVGAVEADFGVLSAGVDSGGLLAPLGLRFPLAAERGYHLQLRLTPGARLGRPMHDVNAGFAAAPMAGGVRLLTGIELAGSGDPLDLTQLLAAIEAVREALPTEPSDPDGCWLGSRPSIADGRPVIGPAPGLARLILAFGHGHIGFSTGPVTGRIVADLLSDAPPQLPIAAFSPARFR